MEGGLAILGRAESRTAEPGAFLLRVCFQGDSEERGTLVWKPSRIASLKRVPTLSQLMVSTGKHNIQCVTGMVKYSEKQPSN